jgi:hypothetical protein
LRVAFASGFVAERNTEQAFDLLARPKCAPLSVRETGSRVSEVRERDDAAVSGAEGGFARSAYRATCLSLEQYHLAPRNASA